MCDRENILKYLKVTNFFAVEIEGRAYNAIVIILRMIEVEKFKNITMESGSALK